MKIKIENNKVEYKFTRMSQNKSYLTPLHWQREIEIVHICEGEYVANCNEKKICAKKGDILVFGSGYTHSLDPCIDECVVDVVMFSAKFLHKFFNKCENLNYHITAEMQRHHEVYDTFNNIFDNISYEMCSNKVNAEIIVQAELIKLWAILTRYFKEEVSKTSEKTQAFEQFQKVFAYIDDNYMHDLDLNDIAKFLNYTPGYISKLFADFSGMTFKKYLNAIRIKKACELMETTDYKLSDISTMCGFGSIRSFNDNFLKVMKCSPSDYMKTQ